MPFCKWCKKMVICRLLAFVSVPLPSYMKCSKMFLNTHVAADATLVTILGMSVYSTYAYLPAYIHNVLVYLGYIEEAQS